MKDICLQGYNSRYITMLCDGRNECKQYRKEGNFG